MGEIIFSYACTLLGETEALSAKKQTSILNCITLLMLFFSVLEQPVLLLVLMKITISLWHIPAATGLLI